MTQRLITNRNKSCFHQQNITKWRVFAKIWNKQESLIETTFSVHNITAKNKVHKALIQSQSRKNREVEKNPRLKIIKRNRKVTGRVALMVRYQIGIENKSHLSELQLTKQNLLGILKMPPVVDQRQRHPVKQFKLRILTHKSSYRAIF